MLLPPGKQITKSLAMVLVAASAPLTLVACAEEPQDQIIEIEDGYDENAANLEQVSLEAAEEQQEAAPDNMEQ
ncbi:hypothetical protein [Sphingomicrobium flavum]|uniref:hypothetical protein n=1 Tax=Sphingomicrobium flavum TaxID=1229164 RepID=UPI0021AE195C|nr:hypothetical protein [Sphingomicrobium flavum]